MDAITELALMFSERDNKTNLSITTGRVIKAPPEVEVRLNDVVILKKHQLVFSAHMLKGYERELELKFTSTNSGATNVADGHSHVIENFDVDSKDAKIKTTDTIKSGDEVIMIPTNDGQLYFVIDKAVRF